MERVVFVHPATSVDVMGESTTKNTQDMRRIREQIFDNTQQICRTHTKILAKYARICDRYSQYAVSTPLRICVWIWLYQSSDTRQRKLKYLTLLPSHSLVQI